jgi:hypothetical protein
MNASTRAAALSSSESTNSRAGKRPFGSATYAILNSSAAGLIRWFEYSNNAIICQGHVDTLSLARHSDSDKNCHGKVVDWAEHIFEAG